MIANFVYVIKKLRCKLFEIKYNNVRSESNRKKVSEIHELFKPHKYRVNADMRQLFLINS